MRRRRPAGGYRWLRHGAERSGTARDRIAFRAPPRCRAVRHRARPDPVRCSATERAVRSRWVGVGRHDAREHGNRNELPLSDPCSLYAGEAGIEVGGSRSGSRSGGRHMGRLASVPLGRARPPARVRRAPTDASVKASVRAPVRASVKALTEASVRPLTQLLTQAPTRALTAVLAALALGSTAAGCGQQPTTAAAIPVVAQTPGFLTYGPTADAYVQGDTATQNYGTAARLATDDVPVRRTFLRFEVAGLITPVLRAVLRLHTTAGQPGSPHGGVVRRVTSTDWSETGLTWRNQPAIDAGEVASFGRVVEDTWYDADVTAVVRQDGVYSFAIVSNVGEAAYYDSRESGGTGPRLVLTMDPAAADPAAADPAAADPAAGDVVAANPAAADSAGAVPTVAHSAAQALEAPAPSAAHWPRR